MPPSLADLVWRRLVAGLTTAPFGNGTGVPAAVVISVMCLFVLPLGFATGFLKWKPLRRTEDIIAALRIVTFRTFLEEGIFRCVILPHPMVDGPMTFDVFAWKAFIPLVLFVAAHFLDLRKQQQKVMRDPRFLVMTAAFGAACSSIYYISGGSLPGVLLMHWLPVVCWMTLLGGYAKVYKKSQA